MQMEFSKGMDYRSDWNRDRLAIPEEERGKALISLANRVIIAVRLCRRVRTAIEQIRRLD